MADIPEGVLAESYLCDLEVGSTILSIGKSHRIFTGLLLGFPTGGFRAKASGDDSEGMN